MVDKVDKVILTNLQALQKKYGERGFTAVERAINALVASDRARGLHTRLLALDDKAQAEALEAPVVTKAVDPRQNKRAIDAVFRAIGPDYLVILGSTDVVPHQNLRNPLHGPDDEDVLASGDSPYACEAPYSRDPQDFVGPTRVVGRIPDVTGSTDASYLVGLLKTAAEYAPAEAAAFDEYFAVTAQVWEKSTRLSVSNIFGGSPHVASVPPKGPRWPSASLTARAHFFNCHGATGDPRFYGEPAKGPTDYPTALDAGHVDGKLREGTIVAAECCYGGELYRLSPTRPHIGLCSTYLANEAYGFFGSTTIAYGPSEGNGEADLICQYFLQSALEGASLGRAALQARQKFVRTTSPLSPFELKTLVQFNLYGDPSLTPVESASAFVHSPLALAERVERHDRRRELFRGGLELAREPVPKRTKAKPRAKIANALRAAARNAGTEPASSLSFKLHYPNGPKTKGKSARAPAMPVAYAAKATLPTAYHVLFAKAGPAHGGAKPEGASPQQMPNIPKIVVFVAKEVDGELASIREIHRR